MLRTNILFDHKSYKTHVRKVVGVSTFLRIDFRPRPSRYSISSFQFYDAFAFASNRSYNKLHIDTLNDYNSLHWKKVQFGLVIFSKFKVPKFQSSYETCDSSFCYNDFTISSIKQASNITQKPLKHLRKTLQTQSRRGLEIPKFQNPNHSLT